MIIKYLKLNNIGPYEGENRFDFEVEKNKNIVLIGGNNGSGKTTLLNSLKIVLFGNLSIGHKTISEEYKSLIKNMLNLNALKTKKINNFYTEICYKEIENYSESTVKINRSWELIDNQIKENVELNINDSKIIGNKKSDYFSRLKDNINVELIDLMIFDGEKISKIIEEGFINEYLKNLIYTCFNFNLYDNIISDLNSYIINEKNNSALNEDEMIFFDKQHFVNIKRNELKSASLTITQREKQLSEKLNLKRDLLNKYRVFGGLDDSQFDSFQKELKSNENLYKDSYKNIIEYLNSDYPFTINQKLLEEAKNQIYKELPKRILDIMTFLEDDLLNNSEYNKILTFFKKNSNVNIIHNSDIMDYERIILKLSEIKKNNNMKFKKQLSKANNMQLSIYDTRKELMANEEKEVKLIHEEIIKIDKDISVIEEELQLLKNKFSAASEEMDDEIKKLEDLNKKLNESKKVNKSFLLASKIIKVNETYINKRTEDIIKIIETLIIKYFNETISKGQFLKKVNIDSINYNVNVQTINGEIMSVNSLSAGEKQIMMGCILKAIYKASERRLPIIIDTPLARLDSKNRISFIENVLKNISDQIIILSTDEEIVGDALSVIKDNLMSTYLLHNISSNKTTVSINKYF